MDAVSETFGLSSSSMSRPFKRASGKKLTELAKRDLSGYDIVAMFLDGKTFVGVSGRHRHRSLCNCRRQKSGRWCPNGLDFPGAVLRHTSPVGRHAAAPALPT